jgi:hypothetical protein
VCGGGRGQFECLTGFADDAERGTNRELRAGRAEYLQDRAIKIALELHRGFVGFDLGEHVAGLYDIAFFFEPLGQRAHGHGIAEFRH